MFCTKCGKQINDNAKFCPYCGESFADDSFEPAPAAEPQQVDEQAAAPVYTPPVEPQPDFNSFATEPQLTIKKKGKGKLVIIIVAIVLVLAIAGGAVYYFFFMKGDDNKDEQDLGYVSNTASFVVRKNAIFLFDGNGLHRLCGSENKLISSKVKFFTTNGDVVYYSAKKDEDTTSTAYEMYRINADATEEEKLFSLNSAGYPLMEKNGTLYYTDGEKKGSTDFMLFAYNFESGKSEKKSDKIESAICFNNNLYFQNDSKFCSYNLEEDKAVELHDKFLANEVLGNRLYLFETSNKEGCQYTMYSMDSENKFVKLYDKPDDEQFVPVSNKYVLTATLDATYNYKFKIYDVDAEKSFDLKMDETLVAAVNYNDTVLMITTSGAYLLDLENHKLGEKICSREFTTGSNYIALGDYIYQLETEYTSMLSYSYKVTPINMSDSDSDTTDSEATEESKKDISGWKVEGLDSKRYTGKVIKPKVDVVSKDGEYAEFDVAYKNNKNAGTADVIITGKGDYTGTIEKTFRILKAKQNMKVKTTAKAVKAAKLLKSKVKVAKTIKVTKSKGKLSYKKVSGSKKLSINKKGVITVKKGKYKKNTILKVKVKVTAKGSKNYRKASKKVTVKIKVK